MPLLSLPTDVILVIFFHLDDEDPLSMTTTNTSTSALATVSLVCKQLCAVARRPMLRSVRWIDKKNTNLNLNRWLGNSSSKNMLHVPKQLVMAVEFDFKRPSSLDPVQRGLDIVLYERIYIRILSFSSLCKPIFSNTTVIVNYLYPVLLALPMLRSLAFVEVEFLEPTQKKETDNGKFSVLRNYPFTSLHLTHLAIRGMQVDTFHGMRDTYEYHPINFLRVPSLQDIEIMWTPQVTAAYTHHIHPKTGIRRQSGTVGWPNTDIPCAVLQRQHTLIPPGSDTGLPLERLTRLTIEAPRLDPNIIRAVKMLLADSARHPSYDPPVDPTSRTPLALPLLAPQNTLVISLIVKKFHLTENLDPIFHGCLAPVVRYEGPLSTIILSLFMDPMSFPPLPALSLTHVSSFCFPDLNEAGNTEIQLPAFGDVLNGLQALKSMSATTATTMTMSAVISGHGTTTGIQVLEIWVYALDMELLYAIQQLFGCSIEKIAIQYAHYNRNTADTLPVRLPDILSGLPRLRSIILQRIPDPSVIFARMALERHAAIVGDHQRFRVSAQHHHQPVWNLTANPPVLNPNQINPNHPHGNVPQVPESTQPFLTLEQFVRHTLTIDNAKKMEAPPAPSLFGSSPRSVDEEDDDDEEDVVGYVSGLGWICKSLWEVQIDRHRFVRWFGEIGERWTRVPVLV
ncbi:hypothetical protein D9619_010155 [Psilocybe cf. subviscida]|uniref:F-box domain-containing protein n=1 Tax=Psilocybe cf. subviscida TaxID=2480587 RepID=A0A8H5ASU6_9AGAR|nr:hypothetical protein D9619_010155 [Psilocybe cf. subviscida]